MEKHGKPELKRLMRLISRALLRFKDSHRIVHISLDIGQNDRAMFERLFRIVKPYWTFKGIDVNSIKITFI